VRPIIVGDTRYDLEDVEVESIDRHPETVSIVLRAVAVAAAGSTTWNRHRLELRLEGVESESAAHYVGNGISAPHPDPAQPLDFVQTYDFDGRTLELEGQRRGESWFVWTLVANSIAFFEPGAG
jgi:hypothetical protein